MYIYDLFGSWQELMLVVHRTRIFGRCFGAKGLCSWTQVRKSRHMKSCHTCERVMVYLAIFRTRYICVYMCIYMYICVCMCIYVYACVCVCVCVSELCVCVYVCVCVSFYVWLSYARYMYTYIYTHTHTTHTHTHTHKHTHTHTHTYIHMCTCFMRVCVCLCVRVHVHVHVCACVRVSVFVRVCVYVCVCPPCAYAHYLRDMMHFYVCQDSCPYEADTYTLSLFSDAPACMSKHTCRSDRMECRECLSLSWSNEPPPPGGVSYLLCPLITNPEEEDPPNLYQMLRGGSSYSGFLIREHSK